MPQYISGYVYGWETTSNPDPTKINLWVDCPYCHREELFMVARTNKLVIVKCQNDDRDLEYGLAQPTLDIPAIEARLRAATPEADATFTAHARQDVEDLLVLVRQLQAEVRLRASLGQR